ncbi:hypothetical protein Pfo_008190 [Paulownia fortunei]|nr:hypothetical protein Pfo_008190 [Paulownia fortunei]
MKDGLNSCFLTLFCYKFDVALMLEDSELSVAKLRQVRVPTQWMRKLSPLSSYSRWVSSQLLRILILACEKERKKNHWKVLTGTEPDFLNWNRKTILRANLKEAERERINRLEEFERKSNVQLERQLMMASEWSRALLTMRGKLKGTEWDPESSHCIDYSDFKRLLDSNNVQFMEYSNYGQTVSGWTSSWKGKLKVQKVIETKEIVFRRHVVDRMPIDCWNDVWRKLHQQLVNVDVLNVNTVPAEVYSTVATAVVWSMRLALSVVLYVWIDNMLRPIYRKLIPCDLGAPPKKTTLQPLKHQALGSLGKSRAKFISAEEKTGVTFDDFAGQEYIKRELQEIVRILKNDEEFQNKGIYCPKGVLLHGPPGTGKTLLAKAIAGEAGLPFFAANGTDFVEMFVGVAASRVKDLFASARSFAPSIIFIDEIDAIGSKRGGPDIGGGGAEREQGLLQILTEMDGFKVSTSQVLVIGATNRLDILDPALLRKGRFDKIVRVGLPSKDGRFAILKVHARNKYFRSEEEKETLLQEIADLTEDFTGAELQNILNEAGILTARKDLDYIGREELLEALKRQKGTFETGQEDSTAVPEELKLRLAYREAAVAVLACYIPDPYRPFTDTDINSISSQPNMRYQETSGRVFQRKADYVDSIVRACAPRVIEEEIFGVDNLCWISAKATLEASRRAEFLILQTGMTAFGKAYYRYQNDLVPNLAAKLEALREEYMRFAVEKCSAVLREYHVLLEKGEIKSDEIWKIYNSSPRIPQIILTREERDEGKKGSLEDYPSNLGITSSKWSKVSDIMNRVSVFHLNRKLMRKEGAFQATVNIYLHARAKFISAEEKTGVTFDDFAGQEYIKRELQEIVRILKNDEEFQNKGIYCPKGVLLHGPPGTGKTLLAKAIAGEAGLPFFAANGTDFVEMFVGVAASRVKDLFASARSFAPSIIFIDEIDAIGSKRGGPDIGGGGAEREQGLLQILTEMDGFKVSTSQVLVIGATNRLDILDPALLRKGRFDKIVRVGLPSKDGRFAILKVHARNKYFRSEEEKETLLQEIADLTEDFTGAELQNILNEAGILTARKDLDYIGREELLEALKRQKGTFETGQEDSTAVPEELKLRLAYREAAVAVLACYIPDPYRPFTDTDINSISSQPNMRYQETSGRVFQRKADYVDSIVRACAPRVIEEEIFGVDNLCWISAKATLEASRRAEFLILQTGMTAFGKAYYRYQNDLVPNLAAKLEALREEYMRFAVEKCSAVLREYHVLLEKGEIKSDEIWKIYNSSPRIPQPAVRQVDEYGALVYAGRWGLHGVSLPGRVTFAPGNVGFSTFGAPRPMETQIISDDTWKEATTFDGKPFPVRFVILYLVHLTSRLFVHHTSAVVLFGKYGSLSCLPYMQISPYILCSYYYLLLFM